MENLNVASELQEGALKVRELTASFESAFDNMENVMAMKENVSPNGPVLERIDEQLVQLDDLDAMLRSLLYEAANSLLTVVRRAHPLKDWARRIRKRAGHKKACVALARKLAVILHRMLITGEAFRWPENKDAAAA